MSEMYLSEIRIFSFNFPPKGWAFCNGQTLPIQQNAALFSLIGTTYGGNGTTNFQLPNLQGNVPIHQGNGGVMGEVGGTAAVSLTFSQIPQHNHLLNITAATASQPSPASGTPAASPPAIGNVYAPGPGNTPMSPQALGNAGGGQPHSNMQPYLVLNLCIALTGIFPSRG